MEKPDLYELKTCLEEKGILISFSGPFFHSIIEEVGKAVKKYLERIDVEKTAMMDVFSVYIEATQNLRDYTTSRGQRIRMAGFSRLVSSSSARMGTTTW
jgi:hypothetical protein